MRKITLLACWLILMPGLLSAQAKDDVQEWLKALEERIRALEAEVHALKAAQATAAPAPAAPLSTPSSPEGVQVPAGGHHGGQSGQLPVYGGASALAKVLHPDIGVIGNFIGAVGRNQINPFKSLSLQESVVSLQALDTQGFVF